MFTVVVCVVVCLRFVNVVCVVCSVYVVWVALVVCIVFCLIVGRVWDALLNAAYLCRGCICRACCQV